MAAKKNVLLFLLFIGFVWLLVSFNLNSAITQREKTKKRNVLVQTKMFPQGGGDVIFNQPWPLPKVKNLLEDFSFPTDQKYLFSNFSYSKGIGNQMFQVASLLQIAKNSNSKLVLPTGIVLRRAFDLQKHENIIFAEDSEIERILIEFKDSAYTATECCRYDQIPLKFINGMAVANGYFQNKLYFRSKSEKEIMNLFTFHEDIRKRAADFMKAAVVGYSLSKMEKEKGGIPGVDEDFLVDEDPLEADVVVIGIHARRGIDVTWNTRNIQHGHTVADEKYYKMAFENARDGQQNTILIVCSDNMAWARKFFNKDFGFVVFCPGRHREEDMSILLKTEALILSTGTFSWWTGYLGNAGKVFYYSNWPRRGSQLDAMINRTEYFLDRWTAL